MTKDEAYRDSIQFFGLTPKNGFKAGKLYSYKPITGTGDFACTRSTTAYRTNQEGELESMAINTPRVDYSNTCPQLLIEDSSTNLLIRSQEFDNASWSKTATSVTANNTTAPDGTTTADKIESTASATSVFFSQNSFSTYTSGVTYTLSIYAKKGTTDFFQILFSTGQTVGNAYANFNLNLGTTTLGAGVSSSIEDAGNGWYRCSITYVSNVNGSNDILFWFVDSLAASRVANFTGSVGSYLYFWGAQQELHTIATSYIPTTTATVTRGADLIVNDTLDYTSTALSVFLRVRLDNTGSPTVRNLLYLSDSSTGDYIGLWADEDNRITFTTYDDASSDQNDFQTGTNENGITNIAFSIDLVAKTYAFVLGGTVEFAGTIVNDLPSTFDELYLGQYTGNYAEKDGIIGVMYFDTELTGGELQSLTV